MALLSAEKWREQLLAASARTTPEEEAQFAELLDMVCGRVTPYFANALLATFTSKPDFGTQEHVCSVLASAPLETQVTAILEEMPRLINEAPDWAEVLLGELIEHQLSSLQRYLRVASAEARLAVRGLLSRPEFREFHPNAKVLYGHCN